MKRIFCSALLGILLIGLLGGCGNDEKITIIEPTPEKIFTDADISGSGEDDSSSKSDDADVNGNMDEKDQGDSADVSDLGNDSDTEADSGTDNNADDSNVQDDDVVNVQAAVDEDKMPVGECIYCGGEAVYVSGAWCCQVCPSVYGEEEIVALTYVGEYLDQDSNEPNLEIAEGDDGNYIVQIGIFRLAALTDGVGQPVPEGLIFTATDPAGNPISGLIVVEDRTAKVTFTDSTWEYIENGTELIYTKSSDVPNIWES